MCCFTLNFIASFSPQLYSHSFYFSTVLILQIYWHLLWSAERKHLNTLRSTKGIHKAYQLVADLKLLQDCQPPRLKSTSKAQLRKFVVESCLWTSVYSFSFCEPHPGFWNLHQLWALISLGQSTCWPLRLA